MKLCKLKSVYLRWFSTKTKLRQFSQTFHYFSNDPWPHLLTFSCVTKYPLLAQCWLTLCLFSPSGSVLISPLLSWLLVEKMNRSSWQRRKSLSSSRSSMRFCSHEFFSSEICSCVRKLVINRYELLGAGGPLPASQHKQISHVSSPKNDNVFCLYLLALVSFQTHKMSVQQK